jgi:hypothetical protein
MQIWEKVSLGEEPEESRCHELFPVYISVTFLKPQKRVHSDAIFWPPLPLT